MRRTTDPDSRSQGRVLVVEDDVNVSEVVVRYLESEGFEATAAADGYAAGGCRFTVRLPVAPRS